MFSDEEASRLVAKGVEVLTDANPFALPAMAKKTAPAPIRELDVFILNCLLRNLIVVSTAFIYYFLIKDTVPL